LILPFTVILGDEMTTKIEKDERFFSVELRSKSNLKNVALTNGSNELVLIEGTIGRFERAEFAEGVVLQVVGKQGVLRIDLSENDITKKRQEGE